MTAIAIREVTPSDARETSTENLMKAIVAAEVSHAEIERQSEVDRGNPALAEDVKTALLATNETFLRVWARTTATLKAELKKRIN